MAKEKYVVNYKRSNGGCKWESCKMYQYAENEKQAISYALDDLEANYYEYDWLKLYPGQYTNGAEYAIEDKDCFCIECYKDFTAEKIGGEYDNAKVMEFIKQFRPE